MHELSIAQAMVEQLADIVAEHGAQSATALTVSVGSLSGVDPEALQMAFPLAAELTPGTNARLNLELVPADARCRDCDAAFQPDYPVFFVCPECGSASVTTTGGRELLITSVELEYD